MESFLELQQKLSEEISSNLVKKYGLTEPEELQRTKQWSIDRRGCFTGSETKKLMSCSAGKPAKMPWGETAKIPALGKTAISYIYSKARERQTKKVIKKGDLFQFQYGKKVEKPIVELFLEKKPNLIYREEGFRNYNSYLGASPDGSFIDKETGAIFGGEQKGAMDYETEHNRVAVPFDQSHMDFWQVQTEMLCLGVDSLFYVTGSPVEDATEVVYGDMTNDEIKEAIGDVDIQLIHASEIHQHAIKERAKLGNSIIELYLSGVPFRKAVEMCCGEY